MSVEQFHSPSEAEERAVLEARLHEMLDRIEAVLVDGIQNEREREEYANATHEYVLGLLEQMRGDDPEIAAKISASDTVNTGSPIMRYLIGEVSRTINTRLGWRRMQLHGAKTDAERSIVEEQFTDGMRKLVMSLLPKFRPPRAVNYGRPTQPNA